MMSNDDLYQKATKYPDYCPTCPRKCSDSRFNRMEIVEPLVWKCPKCGEVLDVRPQPPAPAMRVDDARVGDWSYCHDCGVNLDEVDRLLRENARLRGELAHVRAMLGEANGRKP